MTKVLEHNLSDCSTNRKIWSISSLHFVWGALDGVMQGNGRPWWFHDLLWLSGSNYCVCVCVCVCAEHTHTVITTTLALPVLLLWWLTQQSYTRLAYYRYLPEHQAAFLELNWSGWHWSSVKLYNSWELHIDVYMELLQGIYNHCSNSSQEQLVHVASSILLLSTCSTFSLLFCTSFYSVTVCSMFYLYSGPPGRAAKYAEGATLWK